MSSQTPIACNLSAINEDELEAHRENGEAVFEAILEIRETASGYSFKLPVDTQIIKQAAAFIARERLCCPFFEFALTIQADHDPVWLKLTGREGVKSYIEETLLPKLEAPITN